MAENVTVLAKVGYIVLAMMLNHAVWIVAWRMTPEIYEPYIGFPAFYNKVWVFGYLITGGVMFWFVDRRYTVSLKSERRVTGDGDG